jgi:S-adenosylmethionine:tRNA ribosyltransferase-isomerase
MRRGRGTPNKHGHFRDLLAHLPARSLLVLNDTRVLAARVHARKPTGGIVELLLTRGVSATTLADGFSEVWEALGRNLGNAPVGLRLEIGGPAAVNATIVERGDEGRFVVRLEGRGAPSLTAVLDTIGEIPLPPYIESARRESGGAPAVDDRDRYQTVYASAPGAVAAPTAGLHFTPELLEALKAKALDFAFVTLHVGAGTFLPVKTEDLSQHRMHAEYGEVSAAAAQAVNATRARGGRVICVGTTALRLIESAAGEDGHARPFAAETDIFITPGYRFRVADGLMTNFHLPKSTLFMLVSAFAGQARMREAYAHAIQTGYRFYSYGDSSLLWRADLTPDAS